jgi:hypothetical protein
LPSSWWRWCWSWWRWWWSSSSSILSLGGPWPLLDSFSSVCLSFYPPVSAHDIQLLPGVALEIILTRFSALACEGGEVVSLTQTANVEHQAPVFMYPEDRVAHLYPQSPDSSIPRDCHFPYPLSYHLGHQFM